MNGYDMQLKYWNFSPILNIEESNFNKVLERFYGLGIQGLTKENIQNSLDGRLKNSDEPVVVTIQLGEIAVCDIPGIDTVKAHIRSLKGRNSYTVETVEHMLKNMELETVSYVSFEDENTRGLTGARNGQSNSPTDTWGVYAYNKGVHTQDEDSEFETTRGGSHGIGKIASNAASDLHLMYFANCDEAGDQHLGGTVQLIEHEHEGQCYRSTGYFAKLTEENGHSKFYPYENRFHKVFEKNTRGLKIVIPFLRKEFNSEADIIRTICDNFFVSILKGTLQVNINDHQLNKETIESYLQNPDFYEQDITEMKKVFTPLYVQTYLQQEPKKIVVNNSVQDYEFDLYFNYNEQIPKGRVGIVRTIGMKIEDFTVKSNATKPFNAVLIGGMKEDEYLKSLENESHTKIAADHIKDRKLKSQATRFINNLSKEIAVLIDEEMRKNNPTDEVIDTGDMIYILESQFKSELANATDGTVKLQNGKKLLKTSTKSQKEKRERDKKERKEKPEKPKKEMKRVPKKTQNADNPDGESGENEVFRVNPNVVERLIVGQSEHLRFQFNPKQELKNVTSCNIFMKPIDGMGEELPHEFNLTANVQTVTDRLTQTKKQIVNNKIKGVAIEDGLIQIQMDVKSSYNRALKFIYYVEV